MRAAPAVPALRAALGLLTIAGGGAPPDGRAARWFAPVGMAAGLAVGAVWWVADALWPALLAAAVVVLADAALTGMLHLDGLADCGDGLLAPLERDRRLAAMRDPGIGAFGVVTLAGVLLLRVSALAALAPDPLLLAGLWGAGRGSMALGLALLPYARAGGGLASAFGAATPDPEGDGGRDDGGRGGRARGDAPEGAGGAGSPSTGGPGRRPADRTGVQVAAAGTAGALLLAAVAGGWPAGPAAVAGLLAGACAVLGLARRRLGGFTGDVLGAAGTVGETCGLVLAAAQW